METKRRRSESGLKPSGYIRPNHIYDEVTDPSSEARNMLFSRPRSSWMRDIAGASESKRLQHDSEVLHQEIISLIQQLSQVKQRMAPAAEQSAREYNARRPYYYPSGNGATTSSAEFLKARRACNPYETLGEGRKGGLNSFFMNRSAVKLANIDAMLGFLVSRPLADDGSFSFTDLCAAPGGFSEYLGMRCFANELSHIRGYGMSLLSKNEYGEATKWKMQDSSNMDGGMFSQYQVCRGEDGTGDILKWNNVLALQRMIQQDPSAQSGVHLGKVDLVVADGGFDAQRDSDHQEQISQKLVLCEVAAGLLLLKPGGTLLLKMFGFQTDVIRAMMKDMSIIFDDFVALKPISSRPASAERYVVCKGFKGIPSDWDGERWKSNILLGRPSWADSTSTHLDSYLDTFDRDMLSLNLKTCFSIVSFLETNYQPDYSNDTPNPGPLIDVESYKLEWRLLG